MTAPLVPAVTGESVASSDDVLQVNTAYPAVGASANWVGVFGLTSFGPVVSAATTDNGDFDGGVWGSNFVSGMSAVWTAAAARKLYAGAFDPGQEFIRAAAIPAGGGVVRPVHVRHFSKRGLPGAEEAVCLPAWADSSGSARDAKSATITLNVQGAPTAIANPVAATSAPVLVSAEPTGQTTGKLVHVYGSRMQGVSAVTVGGVAVPAGTYDVNKAGTELVFAMPAGTAGPVVIVATNPVGASNSLNYTRGA